MRSLVIATSLSLTLIGCGKPAHSPEFEALKNIEAGLEVRGSVEDYRANIVEAQQAINAIEDPQRKLLYNAVMSYHTLALELWQCPDRPCEVETMSLIKQVTQVPIVDPATDDPNIVLDMLWKDSEKAVQGLEDEKLD